MCKSLPLPPQHGVVDNNQVAEEIPETQAEEVVRSQIQETIKYQQEEIAETQVEGLVNSQIQEIKAIVNKSHKKHKIVANGQQIKTITKTEIIGMSIKKLSSENNKM